MSWRISIVELPDGEILIDGKPTDFAPPWKTEDAIRQQARDIKIRNEWYANALNELDDKRSEIAKLRADLAAAVARAEQAEARLAAIDNAPTVAVVCSSHSFGQFVQQRFFGSQLPRIGTELIARPAKD